MKTISLADFQVLEAGSFNLNQDDNEKTIGFTIPEDIDINQVVVFQSKITVKEDGSTFEVSTDGTPIWGMKADKDHTRGLWQTFIASQAFGSHIDFGGQRTKTVGITFAVPSGNITFSDVVIWYQRKISV